jgi:hypothetical protein
MTIRNARFSKAGAIYASVELARANLLSHNPPDFRQIINDNDADLLSRGILLEPVHWAWDQDAETITVTRTVRNNDEYLENRTWNPELAIQYAEEAGWQFDGMDIID